MRSSLRHRASVSRNTTAGTDAWNRPGGVPNFVLQGTVPCWAWKHAKRHVRDDGKQAVVEDMRAMFPPDADVEVGDQLAITTRRGVVLFGGPVSVETLTIRGDNIRHKAATLTRHK